MTTTKDNLHPIRRLYFDKSDTTLTNQDDGNQNAIFWLAPPHTAPVHSTQLEDAEFARTAAAKSKQNAELELADVQVQLEDVSRGKAELDEKNIRVSNFLMTQLCTLILC